MLRGRAVVFVSFVMFSFLLKCSGHVSALSVKTLRSSTFSPAAKLQILRRNFVGRSRVTMMPEGPEVRTVIDQLQAGVGRRLVDIRFLSGRYVRGGPPAGFRTFAATMTKATTEDTSLGSVDIIKEWNCKGKFIYVKLDKGSRVPKNDDDFQRSLFITLGMSGRFVSEAVHEQDSRHARWYLELLDVESKAKSRIYYHDQRNFGTLKFCLSRKELESKLESLGPDILDPGTTEDVFVSLVSSQRRQMNICKFLMNQGKLAGVGNYILAEGLYRAQIDPYCALSELDEDQQRLLFRELKATAQESYEAQGMTRQKGGQFKGVDGEGGKYSFALQCYGRDTCARGDTVRKDTNGPHGRTIWYTDRQLFMSARDRLEGSGASDSLPSTAAQETSPRASNACFSSTSLLDGLTDPGWIKELEDATTSDSFLRLEAFLNQERDDGAIVYPPRDEIFSAFNLCPFDQVKVVIVGQDPYHGPGQGHGLAFSVNQNVRPPPSLKNIFREAIEDVGIDSPRHGNLEHWAKQGILMLNAVLTVRQGEANSHAKKGWEDFTDFVIQKLNDEREGIVFLLWGNPAAKKAARVDESRHFVIRTSHPSPLGATKTSSPFLTSRCFSKANECLRKSRQEPIDWSVI